MCVCGQHPSITAHSLESVLRMWACIMDTSTSLSGLIMALVCTTLKGKGNACSLQLWAGPDNAVHMPSNMC